jgi:hypothetical protein
VRCQVARARQRIFNSIGSSSPRWAARRTAGIFEFAPYLTQRATKRCAAMDPLTIFITAMILITLLSLFYILTARPSNVSLNTHSRADRRRHRQRLGNSMASRPHGAVL